jgi:hypothetical protein
MRPKVTTWGRSLVLNLSDLLIRNGFKKKLPCLDFLKTGGAIVFRKGF